MAEWTTSDGPILRAVGLSVTFFVRTSFFGTRPISAVRT